MSIKSIMDAASSFFRGTSLSYPTLSGDGTIGIQLSFTAYSYTAANQPAVAGSNAITLPLPQQIADAAGIKVGEAELGTSGALAVDAFTNGMDSDQILEKIRNSDIGDNVNMDQLGGLLSNTSEAVRYFARSTIDSAFSGSGLAASVVNGNAVNPHATLNFDGVNLKEYNFTWAFAPSTEAESSSLTSIIQTINKNIHPKYSSVAGGATASLNSALLEYPSLITARFVGLNDQNYPFFLYPMMAKNFSVDYSSQGNVVMKGGNPGFVNLSMTLQETKIRTKDDF
jgi:hypothetical protein